jgi:hypothetical protein
LFLNVMGKIRNYSLFDNSKIASARSPL